MSNELPAEIAAYLTDLISDDQERKLAHLRWLEANPNEADHDLQRAETEPAIELATKAATFFPPT